MVELNVMSSYIGACDVRTRIAKESGERVILCIRQGELKAVSKAMSFLNKGSMEVFPRSLCILIWVRLLGLSTFLGMLGEGECS